ncbi:MAG: 3'(2'),5'-bisphosphate nucleotidase CysQ [Acidiferrobacterales bacterium]
MSTVGYPCDLLPQARAIAADASSRILAVYERPFTVTEKQDGSPLTEADRAAHQLIVARLEALTPEIPVLSEESAGISYESRSGWTRFWLVDPLDGTKEFVKRNDEFTVNIALIENRKPVLGVVLAPALKVAYWACRGGGVFKQANSGAVQPIRVRRYTRGKATIAASRSHPGKKLSAFLQSVTQRQGPPETLAMGSALKICLVAEGAADVYPRFGPTSEWDTAAAQCVIEVAGGRLTDLKNQPLAYNKPSLLNPWFLASGAGDYDWIAHIND